MSATYICFSFIQYILVATFTLQHHVHPSTTEKNNCSYLSQNGGHSEWQLAFSVVEDVTHQAGMVEIILVHVITSEMLYIYAEHKHPGTWYITLCMYIVYKIYHFFVHPCAHFWSAKIGRGYQIFFLCISLIFHVSMKPMHTDDVSHRKF